MWKEDDNVEIEIPKGFALDHADQPGDLTAPGVSEYKVEIAVINKSEALLYKRTFSFTMIYFPQSTYSTLKTFFDRIHESDNHTITLKLAAGQ